MKSFGLTPALAWLMMFSSAACSTTPPPASQDIAFLHGCWISPHDVAGVPVDTLRLLTGGKVDAPYSGQLLRYDNGAASLVATLTFSRDGSHAVIDWEDRYFLWAHEEFSGEPRAIFPPAPAGWTRAVFRKSGGQLWIIAESMDERLRIHERDGPGGLTIHIFDGQRDGCD